MEGQIGIKEKEMEAVETDMRKEEMMRDKEAEVEERKANM